MDTRETLRRMRNMKRGIIEDFSNKPKDTTPKKNMTMRDMLAITRKKNLYEATMNQLDINNDGQVDANVIDIDKPNEKTMFDQATEEQKFNDSVKEFNVDVQFEPIEITDDYVVWNGTVDNQIQWSFLVTPDETVNGAKFNYSKNFDDKNPDNEELIKRIEGYYNEFYKFWRDNGIK